MTRSSTGRRVAPVVVVASLLVALGACAEGDVVQRQAVTGEDGFQATGRLDGSRVAISSGDPNVTLGDCDPGDGLDEDLCILARTIDGIRVNLVIENPSALVAGEVLPVRDDACRGADCDAVGEHVVVDLRVDGTQRRATGGTVRTLDFGDRVTAEVDVRFQDGDNLVGTFDVGVRVPSNVPPPPDA